MVTELNGERERNRERVNYSVKSYSFLYRIYSVNFLISLGLYKLPFYKTNASTMLLIELN